MNKLNKQVRLGLIIIWGCLAVFAVIWYIEPQWLIHISYQGKIVEGTEHKLKGDQMLRQGDFKEAYSAYSRALEIESTLQSAAIGKATAAERLDLDNEALGIYNKLLADGADKPYEIYYNLATLYEKQRNLEKTIEALDSTLVTSPDPFDAYVRLARLYFINSKWKRALYYYRQSFDSKPDLKNDYLSTLRSERNVFMLDESLQKDINSFLEKGFSEAEAALYYQTPYIKALKKDPTIARIYNDAGFCYAMLGDLESSLPFFQEAVNIQPENEEFVQNLAKAQHDLGSSK